jgi:hypothetical protein
MLRGHIFWWQYNSQNTTKKFQHLLPLNVISSSGLSVVYNSANFGNGGTFSFVASYNFHNEETCGPRRVSSPLGNFIFIETTCLLILVFFR